MARALPARNPPARAETIGSLLRPPALRRAFRAVEQGSLDEAGFRAAQDDAVRAAVALQEALGLDIVTDGELRRASYWGHFVAAVDGLTVKPARFAFHDEHGAAQPFLAPHVTTRLRRRRGISTDEFAFLAATAAATAKLTLPAPSTFQFWRGRDGVEPGAYDDPAALFADLAALYRDEIADLARLGCTYVQLDEVALAMLADPAISEAVAARGDDPEALVGRYIDAINAAIADRPPGVRVGLHLCRGNFRGKFLASGGYDGVAERVFGDCAVDLLLLEYDTARAGDFAPLRFVPADKGVVLGLISTKTPRLEDKAALARRIDAASRYVPLERLAISPQCGFASAASGNPLAQEDERAKLTLLVETAREIWR